MRDVLVVFGTRPEALKMAPVIRALRADPAHFKVTVCVSGQHRQMLDQTLSFLKMVPDIDLDVMKENQGLSSLAGVILRKMEELLSSARPDLILVHGDTTTAVAAAMSAFFLGIPVGHVEAGLRTHDLASPFPEEFNRQVISRAATWHFAPTPGNRSNLVAEGVDESQIVVTGNTIIDTLDWTVALIASDESLRLRLESGIFGAPPPIGPHDKVILVTGHRRENLGQGLQDICTSIRTLARQHSQVHFVYPVHMNPGVSGVVWDQLSDLPNVHLTEPLGYPELVALLQKCFAVLTDSGGLQEEAPRLGKPVLVMRNTSERPEAVASGAAQIVGTQVSQIVHGVTELLTNPQRYTRMAEAGSPFGDGHAAERIVAWLRGLA